MYHIVLSAKYRCVIFDDEVDEFLKDVCLYIEKTLSDQVPGKWYR